jgi:predicted 2-oxoglutarate/Fe(II)-dependent dioxygenase YbiX/peroxiredoxin
VTEAAPILTPGDPAPWFIARTADNPKYVFNTAAGRYIALCFFGSARAEAAAAALRMVYARHSMFDIDRAAFFGVSIDPSDRSEGRARDLLPGIRIFWDLDGAVSRLYGAIEGKPERTENALSYRGFWLILDPMLRVVRRFPLQQAEAALDFMAALPPVADYAGADLHAPVLVLPRVFEPDFCRHLIERYETHGGEESGFMQESDGKTVMRVDHNHKRRSDYTIEDDTLRNATRIRVLRRIVPELQKAFQYKATRMERYIVACYDGAERAHFRAHRDNTTKGTAHRRFAVTINLNAEAYEGGDLSFPEFGPRHYRAPTGGAVVFSCSLMHEVDPVVSGRRYAFLPFLYDDEAAKVREANNAFLGEGVGRYVASTAPGDKNGAPSASINGAAAAVKS